MRSWVIALEVGEDPDGPGLDAGAMARRMEAVADIHPAGRGPRLHSFLLAVIDDANGTPRPHVSLELTDLDGVDDAWRERRVDRLRDGLYELNIDYRSSVGEFPEAMRPIVETFALGEGPFAADASRIKQRRIAPGRTLS